MLYFAYHQNKATNNKHFIGRQYNENSLNKQSKKMKLTNNKNSKDPVLIKYQQ